MLVRRERADAPSTTLRVVPLPRFAVEDHPRRRRLDYAALSGALGVVGTTESWLA
jgi:hypothetical protein